MENPIFRKKSLEKMSSPENLEEYIKVANPSMWILIAAIGIFLVACMLWGKFGQLETTVSVSGTVKDGKMQVVGEQDTLQKVEAGMEVKLKGETVGTVVDTESLTEGEMEVTIQTDSIANGHYNMHILIESVEPLSFIFE